MKIPLAIIGGSGAYQLLADQTLGREIDCVTLKTPFGDSAPLHRFASDAGEFLFLSRHGEKDYSITAPFVNYRAMDIMTGGILHSAEFITRTFSRASRSVRPKLPPL